MSRFFSTMFGKTNPARCHTKPAARTRLALEGLDDRLVPATMAYDAAHNLFQFGGQFTGAFTPTTSALQINLSPTDSIQPASLAAVNAATGNALGYNSSLNTLTVNTSLVKNVALTDTGFDLVTLGSTSLPGNLSVTAGALTVQSGATVSAVGNIQLTGQGTAPAQVGVSVPTGAKVQADGVTITGSGSLGTTSNNAGVLINGGTVTAGNGGVVINGYGGGLGNDEDGIDLWNAATVAATGSGAVTLNGYAGHMGHDGNVGIFITTGANSATNPNPAPAGAHTLVSAANGSVTISGTGDGSGQWNYGVAVASGATVQATGTGSVRLNGDGGAGTNWNEGVLVTGGGLVSSTSGTVTLRGNGHASGAANNGVDVNGAGTVQSTTGGITLYGGGSGSANGNSGVAIYNGGIVRGASAGGVSIKGLGSAAGTYNNEGVYVNGSNTRVDADGTLSLTGTGAGSGSYNYAVTVSGGAFVQSGLNATIAGTCNATGPDANFGVNITDAGTNVNSGTRDLTIVGKGGGSRNWDYGIGVQAGAMVWGHAVALNGTGGPGATGTMSDGVFLSSATVTGHGGTVALTGIAGSGSSGAEGVSINGSQVRAAIAGDVDLIGSGGSTGDGVDVATGSSVAAPGGKLTMIGYAPSFGSQGVYAYTPSAATGASVLYANLADPKLLSVIATDYPRDGNLSYAGMLDVLTAAAQVGTVTAGEVQTLNTLLADASALGMPDYVRSLADKVVYGDPANAYYYSIDSIGNVTFPSFLGNLTVGSSGTLLAQLTNKWFRGVNNPQNIYDTGSQDAAGKEIWNTASYQPVTGVPLFARDSSGNPVIKYTDIKQGAIGDCWLLASLAEVAARAPADIQNMFVPLQTDAGGNTTLWAVRLYHNGATDWVTVDNNLPSGGTVFDQPQGSLWVALAEKAYAEENAAGWEASNSPGANSYQSINYISNTFVAGTDRVLAELTGTAATGTNSLNLTDMATAWQSGKMMVAGTPDFGNAPPSINGTNIVSNHVYAVVGYSNGTFTLFNPWGAGGGTEKLPNGGTVFCGGTVTATGAQLTRVFSYATTAGASAAPIPAGDALPADPVACVHEAEAAIPRASGMTHATDVPHEFAFHADEFLFGIDLETPSAGHRRVGW